MRAIVFLYLGLCIRRKNNAKETFGQEPKEPKPIVTSKPIVKPISDEEEFPIDSIWEFKHENPFKRFDAQIKKLQEGHILYRHCISSTMCQEESCSTGSFRHMFKRKTGKIEVIKRYY